MPSISKTQIKISKVPNNYNAAKKLKKRMKRKMNKYK